MILHSDCLPMISAVNRRHSKHPHIHKLIKSLIATLITIDCVLDIVHVSGVTNVAADLLSRHNIQEFQRLFPHMQRLPTVATTDVRLRF